MKLFYLPVFAPAQKKTPNQHWLTAARSIGFCTADKISFLQDVADIKMLELPGRFHIEF